MNEPAMRTMARADLGWRRAGLRCLCVSLLAAVAGTVVLASPGYAAATGRIDRVDDGPSQQAAGTVDALFSVPGLPAGVSPDPSTVTVTFEGSTLPARARILSNASGVERTSVLAIDVSDSMRGAPFRAARTAARSYIEHTPSDVSIGIVTFASRVRTLVAPTRSHAIALAALDNLSLSPQTRLYGGVLHAIALAGTGGLRQILLLSDGVDTSTTSLDSVLRVAKHSGIRIDAVALNQRLTSDSPLARISGVSGGSVTSTSDLGTLRAVFTSEARDLAKQLVVTFRPPQTGVAMSGSLAISVVAGGTRYADSAFVTLAESTSTTPPSPLAPATAVSWLTTPWLVLGLALVFSGLAVVIWRLLAAMSPPEASTVARQLELYSVHGLRRPATPSANRALSKRHLREAAVLLVNRVVVRRDLENVISAKLEAAGLKVKPAEWLLIHAGAAVGAGLVGLALHGPVLAATGIVAGIALPWLYLGVRTDRRLRSFDSGLAETLQVMAGGLQAGLTLAQSVETIVREGREPIAGEFQRTVIEHRLGVDIEDALEGVAERMHSVDLRWVVMAIRIQREVGGNLAELLLTVAATIREREYLRRQVSVLSAEGRLSAWILGGLPPLFTVYLAVTRPTYLAPMLHTQLGVVMSGTAIVLMIVGILWLRASVKVEV